MPSLRNWFSSPFDPVRERVAMHDARTPGYTAVPTGLDLCLSILPGVSQHDAAQTPGYHNAVPAGTYFS